MTRALKLYGDIWLGQDGASMLGDLRISLLEHIGRTGSITQAAKAVGVSYKTAWDTVDAMKNISSEPLVESEAGGKRGGGTRLTEAGRRLVATYRLIQQEHERFLASVSGNIEDFSSSYRLIRRLSMKSSARNQFFGTIAAIREGGVNDEVEIALGGSDRIVATITRESRANLGLAVGAEAWALVKASWVILALDDPGIRISARNRLCGTVARLTRGEIDSDVVLALAGGNTVSAVVTNQSVDELQLAQGVRACALFKASSVIVGVPA